MYKGEISAQFFSTEDRLQYIGLPDNSIIKYIRCVNYNLFPFNVKINGITVPITNFINKCYIEAGGDVVIGQDAANGYLKFDFIYFYPG